MSVKSRQWTALLLNAAVVVMEAIAFTLSFRQNGWSLLQFYTEDSNLLALIACTIFCASTVRSLMLGRATPPLWVRMLKYMTACGLALTLVVVVCILAPMDGVNGYRVMLLQDSMLYQHLLCPLVAILSFLFFENEPPLTQRHTWLAMIPTAIYAAVMIVLNILRVVTGPYPFLRVLYQPVYMSLIWVVVILGGAYLLALLLRLGSNRLSRNR